MAVKFVYDHVFSEGVDNREVYKTVASPVVRTAMDGINGTVFAYGVTSSGKTHTMMGDEEHAGIVPHAVAEVLRASLPRATTSSAWSALVSRSSRAFSTYTPRRASSRRRRFVPAGSSRSFTTSL